MLFSTYLESANTFVEHVCLAYASIKYFKYIISYREILQPR